MASAVSPREVPANDFFASPVAVTVTATATRFPAASTTRTSTRAVSAFGAGLAYRSVTFSAGTSLLPRAQTRGKCCWVFLKLAA